jgi:hypothetical protein
MNEAKIIELKARMMECEWELTYMRLSDDNAIHNGSMTGPHTYESYQAELDKIRAIIEEARSMQ